MFAGKAVSTVTLCVVWVWFLKFVFACIPPYTWTRLGFFFRTCCNCLASLLPEVGVTMKTESHPPFAYKSFILPVLPIQWMMSITISFYHFLISDNCLFFNILSEGFWVASMIHPEEILFPLIFGSQLQSLLNSLTRQACWSLVFIIITHPALAIRYWHFTIIMDEGAYFSIWIIGWTELATSLMTGTVLLLSFIVPSCRTLSSSKVSLLSL